MGVDQLGLTEDVDLGVCELGVTEDVARLCTLIVFRICVL